MWKGVNFLRSKAITALENGCCSPKEAHVDQVQASYPKIHRVVLAGGDTEKMSARKNVLVQAANEP